MEHNFGAELGAGCYDGPFVRLSTDSAEPAAAAMESVSVSSEDSMESIINAVVQKILQKKGSNLSMSVDTNLKLAQAAAMLRELNTTESDISSTQHLASVTILMKLICVLVKLHRFTHEAEKYKTHVEASIRQDVTQYLLMYYLVKTYRLFQMDVIATHLLQMVFPLVRVMTLRDLQLQVTP